MEKKEIYDRMQSRKTAHIMKHTGLSAHTIYKIHGQPFKGLDLRESTWKALENYLKGAGK